MRLISLAPLVILVAASKPAAGSSLTITVTDPQQAPIPGSLVELVHRDASYRTAERTDERGVARFETLSPGAYVVSASAPGFARGLASLRIDSSAEEEHVVRLDIAAVSESVVVTSAATAQASSDVTKSVTTLEGDELEERDETFLTEALRTVPGLRVERLGGPGAFTSIKTRGLRNEDTAVLVDGARLRDPSAPQGDASSHLQSLLATNVGRVEILRGTGSTLYGTSSGGGAINIVTAPGGGALRGSALLEGGGLGFVRAAARTSGGAWDRLSYSVGLAHVNVASGVDGNDAMRNTSVQGRALVALDPATSVSLGFYGSDDRADVNESPLTLGALPDGIVDASAGENFAPAPDDPDSVREGSFYAALVGLERRPRPGLGWGVRYHGVFTSRRFTDGPAGTTPFEPATESIAAFDGDVHTLSARADFELGRHQLVNAGFELERESFLNATTPGAPEPFSATSVSQTSQSVFVQDQLTLLGGALSIAGAARAQVFSLSTPEFTPAENAPFAGVDLASPDPAVTADVSAAYAVGESGTRLRAHYGSGYRAPSLYERFGASFSSFGYTAYGDPRLAPEKTLAFDAGVEQRALSDRLHLSATYFRTRLARILLFDFSGAIDPATDPFGRFGGYRTTDGGVTQGLELSGALAVESFRLRASYTYADAEPPAGVTADLTRAFVIPRHQASLAAAASLGPRLSLSFDLHATSDYLAPIFDLTTFTSRVFRFDGYVTGDLVASYRLASGGTGLRIFGKIENVLGSTFYASGYPTPGRYALAGVGFEF